jgi:hypothetical protein
MTTCPLLCRCSGYCLPSSSPATCRSSQSTSSRVPAVSDACRTSHLACSSDSSGSPIAARCSTRSSTISSTRTFGEHSKIYCAAAVIGHRHPPSQRRGAARRRSADIGPVTTGGKMARLYCRYRAPRSSPYRRRQRPTALRRRLRQSLHDVIASDWRRPEGLRSATETRRVASTPSDTPDMRRDVIRARVPPHGGRIICCLLCIVGLTSLHNTSVFDLPPNLCATLYRLRVRPVSDLLVYCG